MTPREELGLWVESVKRLLEGGEPIPPEAVLAFTLRAVELVVAVLDE